MKKINCKKCTSNQCVKNGFVRGLQRYKCKSCSYNFTETKLRGIPAPFKSLAIILYSHCGVSMYKIAKLFGVSDAAVLKWIRSEANSIELDQSPSASDIIMIDEMWHYINGKETKFGSGEPLMGHRVSLLGGSLVVVLIPAARS